MEIAFERGTFQWFKATVKFHLGQEARDIWDGDEVEFDGQTLKIGSEVFTVPSLRAAIRQGWLVPISDNTTKYRPKAAGVEVHAAQTTGRDRGKPIEMGAVADEEAVVSTMDTAKVGQKKGKLIVAEDQEAVPVARLQTPAKQSTKVTSSMEAANEARKLDNSTTRKAMPIKKVADSSDDLADLVEGSVVAAPPPRKKVSAPAEAKKPAEKKSYYKPVEHEVQTLQGSKGQFKWDMNQHWKARVKMAVGKYGSDPKALAAIKAIEVESVSQRIDKALASK